MHLDVPSVLREAAEQLHAATRARRTSMWLGRPGDQPTRAFSVGALEADPGGGPIGTTVPRVVRDAARRGVAVRGSCDGYVTLAVPVIAPRSGALGVLYVEMRRLDANDEPLIVEIAREAGFALETANLYQAAIAEKEKSEAILARVGEAVVVTDSHGTVTQWNRMADQHLGWAGLNGGPRTCAALLGLHDGEETLDCSSGCALLAKDGQGDPSLGRELWRARADGRRQPLLATASALTDADGVVYEVVHSLRDVTKLKEADEAKNLFLATASHELRTPLTVIQGFAQLLQGLPSQDATWDKALDAIARRSVQLNGIVERILLSSRIDAGGVEIVSTPVSLGPILREEVAALAVSRSCNVTLTIDEPLSDAMADRASVTAIIQHLLENALKYSPDGGAIETRAWSDVRGVWLSVRDRGIGMDEEQMARCFDKFWQAESSDIRRFGGTGIGLYIVRSLAVAMGGDVSVASIAGGGATFTVMLPTVDAAARAPAEDLTPPPEDPPTPMQPTTSERSTIQEFMRQIGIPARRQP